MAAGGSVILIAVVVFVALQVAHRSSSSGSPGSSASGCETTGRYKGCADYTLSGQIATATIHTNLLVQCVQPGSKYSVVTLPNSGNSLSVNLTPYASSSQAQTFTTSPTAGTATYSLMAGLILPGNYLGGGLLKNGSFTIDGGGRGGSFDLNFQVAAFEPSSTPGVVPRPTPLMAEAKGHFTCP